MRYRAPLFNCVVSLYFFRVGVCSHTILTKPRGATRGVGFDREEEGFINRVDPSPRDHQL